MNDQRPLFSVIVATYNAQSLIGRTVRSVLVQDFPDWELCIMDGASEDQTLPVATESGDERIRHWCEPDTGIAQAWNRGVTRCAGRWVLFLGAGDELPQCTLSHLARRISSTDDESLTIIYGDTAFMAADGRYRLAYAGSDGLISTHAVRNGFPFMHPTCAFRRRVFDLVGLHDESIRIAIDGEYLLRCVLAGVEFVKGDHTVIMLEGGVSDRRWVEANLEYAGKYSDLTGATRAARTRRRISVHLRHLVFRLLGLSSPLKRVRSTLAFAVIGVVNALLRYLPTFAARRWVLQAFGCHVARSAAVHRRVRVFSYGRITIGPHTTINAGVYLDNRHPIRIGSNVSIAHDARIYTMGHDIQDPFFKLRGAAVDIGDRACVFAAAIVLPRTIIGEGAVVYPGTVVTGELAPYAVARPGVQVQLNARVTDLRYTLADKVWLSF